MQTCNICRRILVSFTRAANDNKAKIIFVPTLAMVSAPAAFHRLAIAYRAMGIPRRKIIDFVADHIFMYDGALLHGCELLRFDDQLEEIFGTDEDPSLRWMSNFLNFSNRPPKQLANSKIAYRLLLLWIALAIHNHDQARLVIA